MTSPTSTTAAEPGAGGSAERGDGPELQLVVQRIRLRLALRLAWLTTLQARGLSDVEIATGDFDRLDEELAWRTSHAPGELRGALDAAERSLQAGRTGHVGHLVDLFGLAPTEVDLLHVCIAAALDDRIGRVFATLHRDDSRRHPTEAVAARLCDRSGPTLATAESPLRLWELIVEEPVAPGEAPAVRLDRTLVAWLQGVSELDQRLVERRGPAHRTTPCRRGRSATPPTAAVQLAAASSRIRRVSSSTAVQARDAGRSPRPCAPSSASAPSRSTPTRSPMGGGQPRSAPPNVRPISTAAPSSGPGAGASTRPGLPASLSSRCSSFASSLTTGPALLLPLVDVVVDLAEPSQRDRWRLWRAYVPGSDDWPEPARSDLVEREHTTVGDIVEVARQRVTTPGDAREALRRRTRDRLGPLVSPMPLPYGALDLVVPDRVRSTLEFLLFECRERRHFWSGGRARLYPQAGLVALLAGPPGVGKTMAAQVLAAELGVDLLRVNLAETISKYVGETAKHLDRILRDARDLDAVLLCDEADTLFGRRTDIRDAHDRWANADTNFLLQAIESYPGIALLATNRKDQLDEAFVRRLRHVIDFPRPDIDGRRQLWSRLLVDVDPGVDGSLFAPLLDRLATHVELTGAEIKHAVLNAAFIAQRDHSPLSPAALLDGLDRELAKQGRSLSDHERRRVLHG